jgi:hypothetical protein
MRLGVQQPVVKTPDILIVHEKIRILKRLGQPEALHAVLVPRSSLRDVVDGSVRKSGAGAFENCGDHTPTALAPIWLAGYAVHVEYRFEGLRAVGGC